MHVPNKDFIGRRSDAQHSGVDMGTQIVMSQSMVDDGISKNRSDSIQQQSNLNFQPALFKERKKTIET